MFFLVVKRSSKILETSEPDEYDLKVFQKMGYNLSEILECLGEYAAKGIKPGKIMNERYDYVAYVKYVGKSMVVEWVRILDLNYLRSPANRLQAVAFNLRINGTS